MTKPLRRKINGLVLLDKPIGMSSNKALQQCKRLFHAEKAGHTGSLDPLACGMLPICLGEATKFSQFLLDADKRYEVQAKLGETTTTQDAEGDIVATKPIPKLSMEEIKNIFNSFLGEITQIPSMYSALKHQGQPLYKLARQGIEVERKSRQITIFDINVSAYHEPIVYFSVHCSKGTYIRSLVDGFGKAIGCGAHVAHLRRTTVDQFPEQNMITLESLSKYYDPENITALDHLILSSDLMCQQFPKLTLPDENFPNLRLGRTIEIKTDQQPQTVRLYNQNNQFQGIATFIKQNILAPKKMIF